MRRPTWSTPTTYYAFPVIGNRPVDEVAVLAVLTPIWTEKNNTDSGVRQRLETVLDWAIAQGWRLDNPAGRGILRVLPRISRSNSHHTALPYGEVPEALARVRESTADSMTRLSFEFLVLTVARSGEVRLAIWAEIDIESAKWTVPAERMTARQEHRPPLPGR